jgi:hypothetical protein
MNLPPMSPEQWDAMRERDRRSDFEARAIADVNGGMPGATARERLDPFVEWRNKTADELSALEAQRDRLQAMLDEPENAKGRKAVLLKTLAQRFWPEFRGDVF